MDNTRTMTDFTELRRDSLARHLRKHLAGEVRFDVASRRLYSTDASIYQIEPLGVVLPKSAEDVVATVQIAGEMHVPITPRGGGTSLSGQSIGPGVVLDCSKYLNAVLDIDPEARTRPRAARRRPRPAQPRPRPARPPFRAGSRPRPAAPTSAA